MYRITVKTCGKYHNVQLGARYCLTKKESRELAKHFFESECDFVVEKWIRIYGTVFCWSETEVEDNIYPDNYWDFDE